MKYIEKEGNLFDDLDKQTAYACLIANDGSYNTTPPEFFLKTYEQTEILTKELEANPWDPKNPGWCCVIAEENKPIICYLVIKKDSQSTNHRIAIRNALMDMVEKLKKIERWNKCICTAEYKSSYPIYSQFNLKGTCKSLFKDEDITITIFYNIKSRLISFRQDANKIINSLNETNENYKKIKKYFIKTVDFINEMIEKIC